MMMMIILTGGGGGEQRPWNRGRRRTFKMGRLRQESERRWRMYSGGTKFRVEDSGNYSNHGSAAMQTNRPHSL